MPIIIESKNRFTGVVTLTALNVETTVVEITGAGDDYLVEGYIDLSALSIGDKVTIKEYIAVDGTNYRPFINTEFAAPLIEYVIRFHTKTLLYDNKYKVTLTQTSGTLRSFPFAFIQEVMGIA